MKRLLPDYFTGFPSPKRCCFYVVAAPPGTMFSKNTLAILSSTCNTTSVYTTELAIDHISNEEWLKTSTPYVLLMGQSFGKASQLTESANEVPEHISSPSTPRVKTEPEYEGCLLSSIQSSELPAIKTESDDAFPGSKKQSNQTNAIKQEVNRNESDPRSSVKEEHHDLNDIDTNSIWNNENANTEATYNSKVPAWKRKQRGSRKNQRNIGQGNGIPNQLPQVRRRADCWRPPPPSQERSSPLAPPFSPQRQTCSSPMAQSLSIQRGQTSTFAFPLASASPPHFRAMPMFLVPATAINQVSSAQVHAQCATPVLLYLHFVQVAGESREFKFSNKMLLDLGNQFS
ncbi:hypothetical protein B0J14DRAFT_10726 [Halenospora varia]|nr:hypothetical protein B0J14DRAFT_10726 [Halenospora varia]